MGASKHEVEARKLLEEHGATFVRQTRHSELWAFPWGRRVGLPGSSPSDLGRIWPNALAEIRRAIKEQEDQSVSDEVVDAERGKPDLNLLGVYVRKKLTVIERHRQEAVVPVEAIAKLLGLPESEQVRLLDVNGKEVVGPVTISIEFDVEKEKQNDFGADELAVPQGEGE